MDNKVKRTVISILGLLQGAIGTFFAIVGLAFAFPDSEPGSLEYEDDMSLAHLGYVLMTVWLVVMVYAVIRLRKSRKDLLSFLLFWFIGTCGMFLFFFVR